MSVYMLPLSLSLVLSLRTKGCMTKSLCDCMCMCNHDFVPLAIVPTALSVGESKLCRRFSRSSCAFRKVPGSSTTIATVRGAQNYSSPCYDISVIIAMFVWCWGLGSTCQLPMSSCHIGHLATDKLSHFKVGHLVELEVSLQSRDVDMHVAGEVDCSRAQMSGRTVV